MRAVLSTAALLSLAPLPVVAQVQVQTRDSAPACLCSARKSNMVYFNKSRGEGPAIGLETSSGSVRDTLGVLVIGVTNNGPADKAGIEEGDRIATANGVDLRLSAADAGDREMHGLMARRLARAVQKGKPGDQIELRVYHDGQYHSVKLTTVKASDLAVDDDGFGFHEFLPGGGNMSFHEFSPGGNMSFHEVSPGNIGYRVFSPGDMPDVRQSFPLPDMPMFEDLGRQIRFQLNPNLDGLRGGPVEIYENGVHRM